MAKKPVELNGYLMIVARKWLVVTSKTLVSALTDMLRALVRYVLVFRFSCVRNKNGPLARTILFLIGAQKSPRTCI
jgi:hypothetical protein